jgi:hypothetical protein
MDAWQYALTLVPGESSQDRAHHDTRAEAALAARLERGWELVSTSERDGSNMFVFRRRAPSAAADSGPAAERSPA